MPATPHVMNLRRAVSNEPISTLSMPGAVQEGAAAGALALLDLS